jgi:parallel beta-helix repeat protein
MAYVPLTKIPQQFFDNLGNPLVGGTLYAYLAGTSTPTNMFSDDTGTVAGTSVVLDSRGEPTTFKLIWIDSSKNYKFILKDSTGTTIWTIDDISGDDASDASISTYLPAGVNAVQTTVQNKLREFVSVKDFGATGDGVTNDAAAIQASIDAVFTAGGGTIYFPAGIYMVEASLTWKSNVHYKGQGKASLLKANISSGAFRIFNQASSDVDNVVFDSLGFDGSINYPVDSTVYKQTLADTTTAIRTSGIKATNVTIKNCYFNKLSFGSIDINGFESSNINVQDNYFYKGSYVWKVISFRLPSSTYTDAQRVANVRISGNQIEINGPQIHWDPSKEDWVASADAIQIDSGKDCVISDNIIENAGAIGIRVEESVRITVANNKLVEPGQEGITFYLDCSDCSCVGNTIVNWGRVPNAYCIRNYSGTYVVAREFPRAAGPTLPANPTLSSWFETWPYSIASINAANIITYSSSDYYTGPSAGILPFRGYAAISVTNASQKISIVGNNALGNLSLDGSSKYLYASDFGITPVHSVNDATATSGSDCLISNNGIVDSRVYRIYHPEYHDQINTRGLLGTAIYTNNRDSNSLIFSNNVRLSQGGQLFATTRSDFIANGINFPAAQVASSDANTLDDYEEGLWQASLVSAGGSITTDTGFNDCSYTKIGRLVTITGEVRASSVSSPTGALTLTGLPFAVGNLQDRAEYSACILRPRGTLAGTSTGVFFMELAALATSGTITRFDGGIHNDAAANIQAGTGFTFSMSYVTT